LSGLQIKAGGSSDHRPSLTPESTTHTTMGFGDFKLRLSSRFGSSSSATQSPMSPCSPLGPGSSKADYAYGSDLSASPISSAPAQSYYDGNHGPPPPYHPESGSGSKEWPVDAKTPVPYNPTDSMGESPLKALEKHDIVIVFDDSHSMLVADHKSGRTRWDQVRTIHTPLSTRCFTTNYSTCFRRGTRLQPLYA
jgi:hypothetical protein